MEGYRLPEMAVESNHQFLKYTGNETRVGLVNTPPRWVDWLPKGAVMTGIGSITQESKHRSAGLPAKGDVLVHPYHGVVVVERTEKRRVDGIDVDCLVIKASVGALTISVPFGTVGALRLRSPMGFAETEAALRVLTSQAKTAPALDQATYRELRQSVELGDPNVLARLIRDLGSKQGKTNLGATGDKLMEWALRILAGQVGLWVSAE